jgi:flagellar biosynthesis protein FliP
MEFGFARFLEMFEERFGRSVTTAILAVIGLAVAIYSIKVILETIAYIYAIVTSTHLIATLDKEDAAAHLIVLGVQITITFVVLWLIWQWFIRRRIRTFQTKMERYKAEMKEAETKINEYMAKQEALTQHIDLVTDAYEKTHALTVAIQSEINKRLAENPQLTRNPPAASPPAPEPQDKLIEK